MEKSYKNYIFFLITPLVFALVGYSYRRLFESLLYNVEIEMFGQIEPNSNLKIRLPYEEQLPTAIPDVHSPIYLIQLAKFESFIFNLLTDFEKDAVHDRNPLIQEKIHL